MARGGLREGGQVGHQLHRVEHLADEGRAPLEAERDHRHPPAVVLVTDPVGHRDAHVVEEDLAELGAAPDRLQAGGCRSPECPSGTMTQEMPSVLGGVGVGADEHLAVLGHVGVAGPDLLAVDHVLVAVPHGPGAQAGQVGARLGLGEALAPAVVALEDGGQVELLLGLGGLGHDRRSGVQQAHEVGADVGSAGPLGLLQEDQVLDGRGAPAAVLLRPVDPGVARRRRACAARRRRRPGWRPSRPRRAAIPPRARRPPASPATRLGRRLPHRCSGGPSLRRLGLDLTTRQIRTHPGQLSATWSMKAAKRVLPGSVWCRPSALKLLGWAAAHWR